MKLINKKLVIGILIASLLIPNFVLHTGYLKATDTEQTILKKNLIGWVSPFNISVIKGTTVYDVSNLTDIDSKFMCVESYINSRAELKFAAGSTIVTGQVINGNSSSTKSKDNEAHAIKETNLYGFNKLEMYYSFQVLGAINSLSIYSYSRATTSSENFNVYIYNWLSLKWDFVTRITAHSTYAWFNMSLSGNDWKWVNNQNILYVMIRDTSNDIGESRRDILYIDYISISTTEYQHELEYTLKTKIPQFRNSISSINLTYVGLASKQFDTLSMMIYNYTACEFKHLIDINTIQITEYHLNVNSNDFVNNESELIIKVIGWLVTKDNKRISHLIDKLAIQYPESAPVFNFERPDSYPFYYFGKVFTFISSWSDCTGIDSVYLIINGSWFRAEPEGVDLYSVIINDAMYPGTYSYYWFANDTYGYSSTSDIFLYQVLDKNPPVFVNVSIISPLTFPIQYYHDVLIKADIIKPGEYNSCIKFAALYYWFNDDNETKYESVLDNVSNYRFIGSIPRQPSGTLVNYQFYASDLYNNSAWSIVFNYQVSDSIAPHIKSVTWIPNETLPTTERLKVYSVIFDNGSDVSSVRLEYNLGFVSMTKIDTNRYYAVIPDLFTNGTCIKFRVIATDSFANSATSEWYAIESNILVKMNIIDTYETPIRNAHITIPSLNVSAWTDTNGTAYLDIPKGNYSIQVTARHYIPFTIESISLDSDSVHQVILNPITYSVSLRIVKSSNFSSYIANSSITCISIKHPNWSKQVYSNKTDTIITGLINGSYLFIIEKSGYQTSQFVIDVSQNLSKLVPLINYKPDISTTIVPGQVYKTPIQITIQVASIIPVTQIELLVDGIIVQSIPASNRDRFLVDLTPPDGVKIITIRTLDSDGNYYNVTYTIFSVSKDITSLPETIWSVLTHPFGFIVFIIALIVGIAISFYKKIFDAFILVSGIIVIVSITSSILVYLFTFAIGYMLSILSVSITALIGLSIGLGIGYASKRLLVNKYLVNIRDKCRKTPNTIACKYLFGSNIPDSITIYNREDFDTLQKRKKVF